STRLIRQLVPAPPVTPRNRRPAAPVLQVLSELAALAMWFALPAPQSPRPASIAAASRHRPADRLHSPDARPPTSAQDACPLRQGSFSAPTGGCRGVLVPRDSHATKKRSRNRALGCILSPQGVQNGNPG